MVLFYDIQGTVYCKQVNKLFFWRMERINLFYIIYNGKIRFGFRTIRFLNSFPERIVFENQGLTVHQIFSLMAAAKFALREVRKITQFFAGKAICTTKQVNRAFSMRLQSCFI